MHWKIANPKDFWTGLIFVLIGAAALWFGREFKIGSAGRMGPGYFPLALAAILVVIGLASLVRSFVTEGERIAPIAWRPFLSIVLACVLFGALLRPAGLVIALAALCIVSASASREFRITWQALAGLVALIAACAIVFVWLLGVPMALGPSFVPLLASWAG